MSMELRFEGVGKQARFRMWAVCDWPFAPACKSSTHDDGSPGTLWGWLTINQTHYCPDHAPLVKVEASFVGVKRDAELRPDRKIIIHRDYRKQK